MRAYLAAIMYWGLYIMAVAVIFLLIARSIAPARDDDKTDRDPRPPA